MPPTAFLFDLENTFFDGTFWHRQLHQMVSRWCKPISFSQFKATWQNRWLPQVYASQLEYWAAWEGLFSELGIDHCVQSELLAAARARLRSAQAGIRPFPGIPQALTELQRAGCRLGILSNSIFQPVEIEALLRRIGIQAHWDYVQTSRAAGHALPTATAFQTASSALGMVARAVTYVSRDPGRVALASHCGLQTGLLASPVSGQLPKRPENFRCLRELAKTWNGQRAA
jgi:FMN phosphatase YigB (HAD superfamily)